MTRNKARKFVDSLVKLRVSATDEQAFDAPNVYAAWAEGVDYTTGTRVLYGNVLYKVLQDHTSQAEWTPVAAPSLFAKVLIPDDNEIYPWEQPDSTNGYKQGDKVKHKEQIWISTVDNNIWEPGVYGWVLV